MAYNKNSVPKTGFYEEVTFTPLIDTLRSDSSDNTPLTDNYVGLYRNVYDMISTDDDKLISNLKYDSKRHVFIITYIDGSTETVTLFDNYLLTASYNHIDGIATFVLNNGDLIKLDLNDLKNQISGGTEIVEKVDEIDSKVEAIDTKISDLESKVEELELQKDSVNWGEF
ncbi:MAG: hypothetical protein IKT40_12215 [Bacilli bacterium]|nr:hypothetical protein [Bacilli bacterium]